MKIKIEPLTFPENLLNNTATFKFYKLHKIESYFFFKC